MSSTRARRLFLLAALPVATTLAGSIALAQNSALAETLFRDAKKLMDEKRYDLACPKFAESERLEPSSGTLLGLALCHEAQGKIATAWGEFNDVVPMARTQGRTDREDLAKSKAQELEARLARLTITASSDINTSRMVMTLDGKPVGVAVLGSATPVDPGTHTVTASVPGKTMWSKSVEVKSDGERVTIEIPSFDAPPPPPPPPPPPTATAITPPPPPPPHEHETDKPSSGGLGTQRIAAIALGGVGVVGLGLGAGFGLATLSKHGDLDGHCTGTVCDAQGLQTVSDAQTSSTIANVSFIAGGVAIAGAAVLWFTAPRARSTATTGVRATPMIGRGFSGVSVQGAF